MKHSKIHRRISKYSVSLAVSDHICKLLLVADVEEQSMKPEKEPSYLKAKIKLGTIFTEKNIFESMWVEMRLKLVQNWVLTKC